MLEKLAFSGRVLRSLAEAGEEKVAEFKLPKLPKKRIALGLAAAGAAHTLNKGVENAREFQAGFAPGVAENRIE